VEIGSGAAGLDLGVDHASQADAEGGQLGGEHLGVRDEGKIGLEAVALLANKAGDLFAANFFLSFKYYAYIDGKYMVI
jgi:hypothetical protein